MTGRVGIAEKNITDVQERMAGNENTITIIEQKLAGFIKRVDNLENGANLKVERWDEATQSLYLVPVE